MPASGKRRLIWIPIVHTQVDMGSIADPIQRLHVRRTSPKAWERHVETVDNMWESIRKAIEGLRLNCDKVRLYQDGLPHCGHEIEIVKELAQAGSKNHRLLLELVEKGAKITGTESAELLLEEYQLAQQLMFRLASDERGGLTRRQKELSKIVLQKRDRYMAERINKTLTIGETGILFIGLLHSLDRLLPDDIQVSRLQLDRAQ